MTRPAGVYRVRARVDCYTSPAAQETTLPPSQSRIDFSVGIRDQIISGVVSDTARLPICSASVRAENGVNYSSSTERNGRYAMQLPAGTYTVSASEPGHGDAPDQTVTVPPHATGTDFLLPAPDNTIRGTVRDNHGAVVGGATIDAWGSAGSYTLWVLDGSWTVSASKTGYYVSPVNQVVGVPPNQTGVDFTMILESEMIDVYLPVVLKPI